MRNARNDGDLTYHPARWICSLLVIILVPVLGLFGCAGDGGNTSQAATHTPHPIVPFNVAINDAAEQMFQSFKMDGDRGSGPLPLVIDPLIDGATGAQTKSTNYIQDKVIALIKAKYTRFQVQPFTASALDSKPLVLIGTLNTINPAAEMKGKRTSWWICVVLVDLKSKKVVAKGVALAQLDGVDDTPLQYFRDSPAWTMDDASSTYVKNCQQTKVGDFVDARYLDGLYASSLIAQAIEAYDNGQYQQALDLYRRTAEAQEGDQFRRYLGLYLTNEKLGDRAAASDAFQQLVDYGLMHKRLAVKFLFRPGTTVPAYDPQSSGRYKMWLEKIAQEATARDACLVVTGHTSPTGLPPVNLELSVLRANFIKDELEAIEPPLATRTIAGGVGSRENLVGTGRDDESDALDRRVEFRVLASACTKSAEEFNRY